MESIRPDSAPCPMCGHVNTFNAADLTTATDRMGNETACFGHCTQCGERFAVDRDVPRARIAHWEKIAASIVLAVIAALIALGLLAMHT